MIPTNFSVITDYEWIKLSGGEDPFCHGDFVDAIYNILNKYSLHARTGAFYDDYIEFDEKDSVSGVSDMIKISNEHYFIIHYAGNELVMSFWVDRLLYKISDSEKIKKKEDSAYCLDRKTFRLKRIGGMRIDMPIKMIISWMFDSKKNE